MLKLAETMLEATNSSSLPTMRFQMCISQSVRLYSSSFSSILQRRYALKNDHQACVLPVHVAKKLSRSQQTLRCVLNPFCPGLAKNVVLQPAQKHEAVCKMFTFIQQRNPIAARIKCIFGKVCVCLCVRIWSEVTCFQGEE